MERGLIGEKLVLFIGIMILVVFIVTVFVVVVIFVQFCKALCIHRLEYKRYFSEDGVFEGDEVELIEEFTNHSFVPMFLVDVETHISAKIKMQGCLYDDELTQCFVSRFFVKPYTKIRRVHKATCLKRGLYKLETAKVTFAGVEVYLDSVASLHVYPKEIQFEEMNMINSHLQYSARSKRPLIADNFSFAGVRKYVSGDLMNNINYKASARRGELMVNDREYMLGRKVLVYINFQPNERKYITLEIFWEYLEKELSYAAYIFSKCAKNGYLCALSANSVMENGESSVRFPFSVGERYYEEILMAMSEMGKNYGVSIASVIDKDIDEFLTGAEVFLFTTYVDEALELRIEALERCGNAVNIVNILEW